MTQQEHEDRVMLHRYCYYVLAQPLVSDFQYDIWEREAREVCATESPVHGVGSCLPSSYPERIKQMAEEMAK